MSLGSHMSADLDPRPLQHGLACAALRLVTLATRHRWAVALADRFKAPDRSRTPSGGEAAKPGTAVVRIMGRLGLLYVTAIMTALSAVLSVFVAWLFSFVIDVPNYHVHLFLAFVIPFFVTPLFSYLSAISMRELQRARKRAVDLAWLDALTGLSNRRAFFDMARRIDGSAHASRGVLFIDIDHFKAVNDSYGHDAGDAVLKHFAELLGGCTRTEDFVARIGGEEFAVHAVDVELAGLAAIANGLLARVRTSAVAYGSEVIRYRVSIGGAIADPALPIDKLLSLADTQLYDVKRQGRDSVRIIDARTLANGLAERPSEAPVVRRPAA